MIMTILRTVVAITFGGDMSVFIIVIDLFHFFSVAITIMIIVVFFDGGDVSTVIGWTVGSVSVVRRCGRRVGSRWSGSLSFEKNKER